jgi:hypothetical protein
LGVEKMRKIIAGVLAGVAFMILTAVWMAERE